MLKPKFKILLSILLVLLLITSFCLATEEPSTAENANTTENANAAEASSTTGESSTADVQITPAGEEATVTPENAQTNSNEQPEAPDWISNDLFQIKDTVNVNSVVDGNAFIIGKDVSISGEIGGDLFVIADKLTIDGGYVYSSIFAIANEITIKGSIYDLYAKCNTLNLEASGSIYRDIKVSASNTNISGKIRRNAYISTSTLNISENSGELISGDLNYTSSKEATIPQGSVAGEVNFSKASLTENTGKSVVSYILDLATAALFTFVVILLLLWLAPKFVDKFTKTSGSKVLVALGIGIIAPICVGIVCFMLLVSMVGIPISACIAFIYFVLAITGKSIASIYLGKLLTDKIKAEGNKKLILFTLLAVVILWLITLIPVIGGIVKFLATSFGIGLVIINLFRKKEISE